REPGGARRSAQPALGEFLRRHRVTDQVTLDKVATHGDENRQLGFFLDAFGHHGVGQGLGQGDDVPDDFLLSRIVGKTSYEGLVELQHVGRYAGQVDERRVARAEIIERHTNAVRPQRDQRLPRLVGVIDCGRFEYFDLEATGVE